MLLSYAKIPKHGQMSMFCTPIFQFDSLNPFPNKPWFLCVCSASLLKTLWENTVGKAEIALNEQFLLLPQTVTVFVPCRRTF